MIGMDKVVHLGHVDGNGYRPADAMPALLQFFGYDPLPEPKTLPERLLAKRRAIGLVNPGGGPGAWGRPGDLERLGTG